MPAAQSGERDDDADHAEKALLARMEAEARNPPVFFRLQLKAPPKETVTADVRPEPPLSPAPTPADGGLTALPPAEARRLIERFEWHYTPKHGSWLDMAESELAILSGQCLSRRIPDRATLKREVAAWVERRNTHHAKADWRFTAADARIKLKSLYPSL